VANVFGILDLFEFDRCTGSITLLSNLGQSNTTGLGYYGCSFSANGNVLYASYFDSLYQFDLSASNIKASKLLLMSVNNTNYVIGQHLIGPDNKIYIALGRNNWTTDSLDYYMSVINYPDSIGYACDLRPHSFWLGGHRSKGGLPNLPHYELGALTGSVCDSLTTGIMQMPHANTVRVYLAEHKINLSFDTATLTAATFSLYNALGSCIAQYPITKNTDAAYFDLPTASGIYIYKITGLASGTLNGKLLIGKQ
jgi:hypothetical protein